jgi:hypothetical protein
MSAHARGCRSLMWAIVKRNDVVHHRHVVATWHACGCGSFVTWKLSTVRWCRLCHAGDMARRGHVVVVAEPLARDVAVDVRCR